MIYSALEIQAHAAETETEISDAKTAVLSSEKLITEDEMYDLLTLLNSKQDALEAEQNEQHGQFRADANSQFLLSQVGRY